MNFCQISDVGWPQHEARWILIYFSRKARFSHFLKIFLFLVNIRQYGNQYLKTLLLHQIAFDCFQTWPKFSSQWSSPKYCFGLLKVWVSDFSWFFSIFANMEPNGGATIPKRYSFYKLLLNCPKLLLNFVLNCPHRSTVRDVFRFTMLQFPIVTYKETNNCNYLTETSASDTEWKFGLCGNKWYSLYTGYFW